MSKITDTHTKLTVIFFRTSFCVNPKQKSHVTLTVSETLLKPRISAGFLLRHRVNPILKAGFHWRYQTKVIMRTQFTLSSTVKTDRLFQGRPPFPSKAHRFSEQHPRSFPSKNNYFYRTRTTLSSEYRTFSEQHRSSFPNETNHLIRTGKTEHLHRTRPNVFRQQDERSFSEQDRSSFPNRVTS